MDVNVTFASLLTSAGVVTAALIVTTLVQLIKGVFPILDARMSGALMSFILSAILYVFVALSVGVPTLDAGFAVFLAWLSCATSAVGIKAGIDHATTASAKSGSVNDAVANDAPPPDDDIPPATTTSATVSTVSSTTSNASDGDAVPSDS